MYSFIVFALTTIQLGVVGISYLLAAATVFYTMTVYGSPLYLLMSALRADSAFLDSNLLYLGMFVYHLVKYGFFFLAQRGEGFNFMLISAIIFEAIYLFICGYYMN